MARLVFALLLAFSIHLVAWAQDRDAKAQSAAPKTEINLKSNELRILDYPELHVTPSASSRLQQEAKDEKRNVFSNHSAMFMSSLATLVTAFQATNSPQIPDEEDNVDNNKYSTQAGYAIGGGWLLTNLYLMMAYKPYEKAYERIKKMPEETQRHKLARERYSEEALYAPAKLGTNLLWFSVVTNFSASVYMAGYGDDKAKLTGAVSALVALTPIFFPYDWINTANTHKSYKKRIYGPVAGLTILRDGSQRGSMEPGLGLTYSF